MKPAKAKVVEAAKVLLPELQLAADSVGEQLDRGVAERNTCARVAGLLLSGEYILPTYENRPVW